MPGSLLALTTGLVTDLQEGDKGRGEERLRTARGLKAPGLHTGMFSSRLWGGGSASTPYHGHFLDAPCPGCHTRTAAGSLVPSTSWLRVPWDRKEPLSFAKNRAIVWGA